MELHIFFFVFWLKILPKKVEIIGYGLILKSYFYNFMILKSKIVKKIQLNVLIYWRINRNRRWKKLCII